jgi:hypothetical protein
MPRAHRPRPDFPELGSNHEQRINPTGTEAWIAIDPELVTFSAAKSLFGHPTLTTI